MAVLQMQRISLCALKKDRKAILETLQRRGGNGAAKRQTPRRADP